MPFFADTNICCKWESDPNVKANWESTRTKLEAQGHRYVSSPLVLIELLTGLVKPEPQYFTSDAKRFAFLAGQPNAEFLPFPGAFVLKTVLNIDSPVSKFNAADFTQWLECVRAAPSRDALGKGEVELHGIESVTYPGLFTNMKNKRPLPAY